MSRVIELELRINESGIIFFCLCVCVCYLPLITLSLVFCITSSIVTNPADDDHADDNDNARN